MRHIYTVDYYSAVNGEIVSFAEAWVDPESGYYANQTGKEKNHMTSLKCGIESKKQQVKKQNKLTGTDNRMLLTREEAGRGGGRGERGTNTW